MTDVMTLLLLALAWWGIGLALFLRTCWCINPVVTVGDLVVGLFGAVMGPLLIIHYLHYAKHDWWNKRIF